LADQLDIGVSFRGAFTRRGENAAADRSLKSRPTRSPAHEPQVRINIPAVL